jgi:hypothetical protein
MTVFAVICLAFGTFLYFLDTTRSPIFISQSVEIKKAADGTYYWVGKIKNTSDEAVTLVRFEVSLSTADEYQKLYGDLKYSVGWFEDKLVLQPDAEFDLSENVFNGGVHIPKEVTDVHITWENNGVWYGATIYPRISLSQIITAVVFLSFGVFFLLMAVLCFVLARKRANKIDAIKEKLSAGELFVSGKFMLPGMDKKAVTKSILSGLGGAISAIFLGVGFYKIYSGAVKQDFIIRPDGILINNKAQTFIAKADLKNPTVSANKKYVTLVSATDDSKVPAVFSFDIKSSGVNQEDLFTRLSSIAEDNVNIHSM